MEGGHGTNERGDSEETSDLIVPPLNLVLYMHLRIFAYAVLFVHWTCSRDEVNLLYFPVLTMYRRTYGAAEGYVLVLHCVFRSSEAPITDSQTSDIRLCSRMQKTTDLFPTGGRTAVAVRSPPPESLFCYCRIHRNHHYRDCLCNLI
jgi:hypothetical protein